MNRFSNYVIKYSLNYSLKMFFLSFFQIGGKFKSLFGEAFYRMVVIDFYPSLRSLIVRSAILIDPDPENLYHATNIWFSIYGYINLGTFPLMPINIYLIGKSIRYLKYECAYYVRKRRTFTFKSTLKWPLFRYLRI